MDAPILVVGSQSIHLERFVRGLAMAGQRVVVASEGPLELAQVPGVLDAVTLDLSTRSWSATARLRALIRRWKPWIVHAHQASGIARHAVRAARSQGMPSVVTLWGSDVLRLNEWNCLHRWMVRWALRSASAWTADAQVLLDAAQAICGPTPAVRRQWIPIGIDPLAPAPVAARERRMLSCRLHKPLYRIDAILRAFARVAAVHVDWVLEVAAAGTQTDELKRLAAELGLGSRVEFSGMLSPGQLSRAYARSAIFVSVPESDGTSVSLLEAMAAGCLPVLSDLPANREWIEDGRNGLLVADPAALEQALLRALQWWEEGDWDRTGRRENERRVAEQAMFPDNIRQFVALYGQLRVGQ